MGSRGEPAELPRHRSGDTDTGLTPGTEGNGLCFQGTGLVTAGRSGSDSPPTLSSFSARLLTASTGPVLLASTEQMNEAPWFPGTSQSQAASHELATPGKALLALPALHFLLSSHQAYNLLLLPPQPPQETLTCAWVA